MTVGDYVRTKYGISQFKKYDTTDGKKLLCIPVKDGSQGIFANVEDIIKSSPNIIDLIEVGDYVNKVRMDEIIEKNNNEICFRYKYAIEKDDIYTLKIKDIKSIVTKEQFSSMEYKIGE